MDMTVVRVMLKVGSIFAITPPNLEPPRSLQRKLYPIGMFLILTLGTLLSFYCRWSEYITLSQTKFVLKIILDTVLYCHNCDTIISVMIFKLDDFLLLMKNLKRLECYTKGIQYIWPVIFSQIVIFAALALHNYLWISLQGMGSSDKYLFQNLPSYTLGFNVLLAYVVLKMLLVRYRCVTKVIKKKAAKLSVCNLSFLSELQAIKNRIFLLKQSTKCFNYVFGWTILAFIFYGVTLNLYYVDMMLKERAQVYGRHTTSWVAVHVSYYGLTLSAFWIGFIAVAVLCDLISNEHHEILTLLHKMEITVKKFQLEKSYDISSVVAAISECRPVFTAARFFVLDRSAIFSVLNSITTFLLVIIQFKPAA